MIAVRLPSKVLKLGVEALLEVVVDAVPRQHPRWAEDPLN